MPSSTEASALSAFLEQNGVPTYLAHRAALPGLEEGVVVTVPKNLLHRARWLTADRDFTDEELDSLATGERPDDVDP